MKKFTLLSLIYFALLQICFNANSQSTQKAVRTKPLHRCFTMEAQEEAIRKDPSLPEKWRIEGEKQWAGYLKRLQDGSTLRTQANEIIIPIVFHIVDVAATQAWITDRDVYEQVEILNRDYAGKKLDFYSKVVPPEIAARVGRVKIRFVLARRTPGGALTSGIERRINASPNHVAIKSNATGGLDAWDVTKYVNVWCGTFSGAEDGLLGIATFPHTDATEGAQGVVIGTATLPFTSPTSRAYYPQYSEGATLSHEIGHYFYLYHTFGDQASCNNNDFQLQPGWLLPTGAGPEGDDTPMEKGDANQNYVFGNPSMNYSDGCATETFGMMYGSFMNYFDDRALFMFSNGMRKRVEGCIDAFRPGLKTSNGATPPSAITDVFLVTVSPRGTFERVSYAIDNSPFKATIRNGGTAALTTVTVNVKIDAGAPVATTFSLNLAVGSDTTLTLPALTAAAGTHAVTIFVTAPSPGTDAFLNNDTIQSFVNITPTSVAVTPAIPFVENFSSTTFPPPTFKIFNPNGGASTWTRDATSGFTTAGSAKFDNYNIQQIGTLDELITVPLDFGTNDSAKLTFAVAHAVVDITDVSTWDGLEVYVSNDGGQTYALAYKKTGNFLKTIAAAQPDPFSATPAQPDRWRTETINLSPYLVSGQKLIIKFRNTNAWGNNTFLDDINITAAVKPQFDIQAVTLLNTPDFTCTPTFTPSVVVKNIGAQSIPSYKITYYLDNGTPLTTTIATALGASQTATIALTPISLTPGNHVITVIANTTGDPNTSNDTLRKSIVLFPVVDAPLVESFEGTGFPPSGWAVANPDGRTTWAKTATGVRKVRASDTASIFIRNYAYTGAGARDELYTPIVKYANVDSVFLQFDVAAATFNYPGATAIDEDTLEVLITKDCGTTFQSVYKKWGAQLQTLNAPNDPVPTEFAPGSFQTNWRRDSVNLLPFLGASSSFQVIFRSTHNGPGNNVYLDNVNISTRVLPTSLKQQGYLILPTAFNNQFSIWHYMPPTTLRGVNVYNSVGQLLFTRQFNGNADTFITVDISGKPAGIYFVSLRYADTNKNITQKVVKY